MTNAVGFAGVALISLPTLKGQDWATVPVMFAEMVLLVNGIHRSGALTGVGLQTDEQVTELTDHSL